jgi:hypothetical protein
MGFEPGFDTRVTEFEAGHKSISQDLDQPQTQTAPVSARAGVNHGMAETLGH